LLLDRLADASAQETALERHDLAVTAPASRTVAIETRASMGRESRACKRQ
jgi:hypothetical protein